MKLQVTQENLHKALGIVTKASTSRGTLPILANVMIKVDNNRLSLSATNLDIAITEFLGAKVEEEGSITVPARLMQDFISSLPGGVIDLKLDEFRLHIATDQYKSVINGVSAEDFPVMPTITEGKTWSIQSSVLKKALAQVIMAASTDEARPVLTGVLLHTIEGRLYMAATDSYRLAEKELMAYDGEPIEMLIPVNAMQDLNRIVSDFEGDVVVTSDEQQVLFQVGDVELVTRLIEGRYPDYRKLIPDTFATTAALKRSDFMNVTKVSSLFARESAGSITINVDEDASELTIKSIASQLGENNAKATAAVTGSGSITLNSRYLMDALHALGGEDVTFSFNGKLEPTVIKDPGAADYVHIVMPLKS